MDAMGPETDFTLETDRKCVQKTNEHSFKPQNFTKLVQSNAEEKHWFYKVSQL